MPDTSSLGSVSNVESIVSVLFGDGGILLCLSFFV
jgi:hypothetical protein